MTTLLLVVVLWTTLSVLAAAALCLLLVGARRLEEDARARSAALAGPPEGAGVADARPVPAHVAGDELDEGQAMGFPAQRDRAVAELAEEWTDAQATA